MCDRSHQSIDLLSRKYTIKNIGSYEAILRSYKESDLLGAMRPSTLSWMTPATFVDRVGGSFGASSGASPGTTEATDLLESVNIGGVQIEFVGGSLDGSSEGAQPGRPVSFKPPNFSG